MQDNGDHLHFNADALYQLGLRYFDEFEKLHDGHRDLGQKRLPRMSNAVQWNYYNIEKACQTASLLF